MTNMLTEEQKNSVPQTMHKYTLATGISLISMSMLFLTLFISFWILRVSSKTWPPLGVNNFDLLLPILNTIVIGISSWFLHQSMKSLDGLSLENFSVNFKRCFYFGLGFMVVQCLFWYQLYSNGVYIKSGILGSLIYTYTLIHFAHVIGGIIGLVYVFKYFSKNHIEYDKRVLIKSIANFWHFLGIIWILTFVHLVFLKL